MDKSAKLSGSKTQSRGGLGHSSNRFGISATRSSRSLYGSRTSLYSGSRRSLASESKQSLKPTTAQILDDTGTDVTPQPLLRIDQPSKPMRKAEGIGMTESGLFPGANATFMQSRMMFGSVMGSAMGTSMGGASAMGSMMSSFVEDWSTSRGTTTATTTSDMSSMPDELQQATESSREELTSDDLESAVNIKLKETDNIWLLDIASIWVDGTTEDAEIQRQKNEQYVEYCKSRIGNDKYSERAMQTINDAPKSKYIQTDRVEKEDASVLASVWDMYDIAQELEEEPSDTSISQDRSLAPDSADSKRGDGQSSSRLASSVGTSVHPGVTAAGKTSLFTISTTAHVTLYGSVQVPQKRRRRKGGEDSTADEEDGPDPSQPSDHPVLATESLKASLRTAERAVTQNVYQPRQARYRGLDVLPDPDREAGPDGIVVQAPHLEKLWGFRCPLARGLSVTSMAWNPANPDILAAGYGSFNESKPVQGLVCCWSLKNPEHPERTFYSSSGVTSVSFSTLHPNLLAAGLYNGIINIYNCRKTTHEEAVSSRDALFHHSGPVWKLDWVLKERSMEEDRNEVLVSIGVDGRVLQWSIRKGFDNLQLLRLKRMIQAKPTDKKSHANKNKPGRQPNPQPTQRSGAQKQPGGQKQHGGGQAGAGQQGSAEAFISQHAPGMSFEYWGHDSNIYLVCTEEGFIHKCSCSYNEQFLQTYKSHTGPVYKVLWHRTHKDLFLSCSGDWTIKLWHQDKTSPLHTFHVMPKPDSASGVERRRSRVEEDIYERKVDHSVQSGVLDADWSPSDQTVFACVRGSRIEIWNLHSNIHDPILTHKSTTGARQTALCFSHNSQALLVGDSNAEVSVYLPQNVPPPPPPGRQGEALLNVLNSLDLLIRK